MIAHSTFISGVEKLKHKISFESILKEEKSISETPYNLFSDTNTVIQDPIDNEKWDPLFSPEPNVQRKEFLPELIFKSNFPVIEKKVA